jgi:hypothetical protein
MPPQMRAHSVNLGTKRFASGVPVEAKDLLNVCKFIWKHMQVSQEGDGRRTWRKPWFSASDIPQLEIRPGNRSEEREQ